MRNRILSELPRGARQARRARISRRT
jgi:hypothetical protein